MESYSMSFCNWFISLNIMLKVQHVTAYVSFLSKANFLLYVCTTFCLSIRPLGDAWLLPPFGCYYEACCYEYGYTVECVPRVEFVAHLLTIFNFEKMPYCFPQYLNDFIFPPTVHKGTNSSTSSPTTVFYF